LPDRGEFVEANCLQRRQIVVHHVPQHVVCGEWRGTSQPRALSEPDVNLSIHPARATLRRLPPSVETDGLLRSPVGPLIPTRVTPSLRSVGITPRHRYYGGVRPWAAHRYFRPRGFSTCVFSLGIAVQVLKFRTKAQIGVTPPLHRTPHGQ